MIDHTHGTTYGYWAGCRCTHCTEAKRIYNGNRRRQMAYGRWGGYVLAHDTQQTIKTLHATGVTYNTIGRATGLTGQGIRNILTNTYVRQQTADRIAAIAHTDHPIGRPDNIPSAGTFRRIEGLRLLGWDSPAIDEASGLPPGAVKALTAHRKPAVTPTTAEAIKRATRILCARTAPDTGRVRRARTLAVRKGYVPLMAWSDIDDPTEVCKAATPHRNGSNPVDPEVVERIHALKRQGLTDIQIAHRTGYKTASAVQKIRTRNPEDTP